MLMELTTAMAVFGILIGAISIVLAGAIHNSSEVQDQATLQSEARFALDTLVAELRQGYSDSTLPGQPYSIQTASGTALSFYTPDRQTPMHMRLVAYRLSSGQLQKAVATSTNTGSVGPWTGVLSGNLGSYNTLLGSVQNATPFTYWQQCTTPGSGGCGTDYLKQLTGTITISSIDVVRVTLTVAPTGALGKTTTYVESARA